MNISRRKFMQAGIMVAACAGIPLKVQLTSAQRGGNAPLRTTPTSNLSEAAPETPGDMLGYYNKSTFTPHVNTEFRVRLKSNKVRSIRLVEVKDYADASSDKAAGEESFSLFFTAPRWRSFPQDTYEVEHAALGKFSLFIVPTGMRSGRVQYFEAAFNRVNK